MTEELAISPNDIDVAASLDYNARFAALMEASGFRVREIDEKLGKKPGYVYRLRQKEEYREAVREYHAEIARKYVEKSTDLVGLFNEQIGPSVATLIEVRDNRESKAGDRIKASREFLDRAPLAPKARREMDEKHLVISIPVSTMEGMKRALLEEGTVEDKEILELVEGKDWKREDAGGDREEFVQSDVKVETIKVRQM
jgi:hypothetical protein